MIWLYVWPFRYPHPISPLHRPPTKLANRSTQKAEILLWRASTERLYVSHSERPEIDARLSIITVTGEVPPWRLQIISWFGRTLTGDMFHSFSWKHLISKKIPWLLASNAFFILWISIRTAFSTVHSLEGLKLSSRLVSWLPELMAGCVVSGVTDRLIDCQAGWLTVAK